MGELYERFKLNKMVNAGNAVQYFKENSLDFFKSYTKSTEQVKAIPTRLIRPGKFYFLHYKDDSNWIKWSPVFVTEEKKYESNTLFTCVNFNFIPLEIRILFFDKYIKELDFEQDVKKKGNHFIKVKHEIISRELKKLRLEYSIQPYNASQIVTCHRIMMEDLPRFLYSAHPKNKYDPKRLIQLWKTKAKTSDQRDDEMMRLTTEDLYNFDKDFTKKFDTLTSHVERFRKSIEKYG